MLNFYNNIRDPRVMGEIDVYTFLDMVKNPEEKIKTKISIARFYKILGDEDDYSIIKAQLPCFTPNFSFDGKKSNNTIKEATGFIYLDVDNNKNIELENPLIFASWLSLSGLGRGVLVKVDNLTLNNFKTTYEAIGNELNINADKHANKATQYCIHSYDEEVYINNDSISYQANEETIVTPNTVIYRKEKRKVNTVTGVKQEWLYNNVNDFGFHNNNYLFFPNQKEMIAIAYIPKVIKVGSRNQTLSAIAHQIKALNPKRSDEDFMRFILNINSSRCIEPLNEKEVLQIVYKKLNSGELKPILNKERRILFNPKSTLTRKEKISISNKLIGQLKTKRTISEIKDCLLKWDIEKLGKVTQKKLAKDSRKNIKTIEKYYSLFRDIIKSINQNYQS